MTLYGFPGIMGRVVEKTIWFVMVLLVTGAFSGGCQAGKQSLPFRSVPDPGTWGLASTEAAYLVVAEKNWQAHYPTPPAGADFKGSFYVVASWGMKPNPGYRISIRGIEQAGPRVEVKVGLEEPDPGKIYPQVLVHPLAVAEVRIDALRQHGLLAFEFLDQRGKQLALVEAEL